MTFRVLKLVDNETELVLWEEVGAIETDYSYLHPSGQEIGEKFGTGTFLTIKADDTAASEKVVASKATYYEFVPEEAPS